MLLTNEHMRKYIQDNPSLVTAKKQAPGLTVLKYHNRVFWKNLWSAELLECRGTVVDDTYQIVQRPFTKIFNLGEWRAPVISDDEDVFVIDKINGYMAAATWHNDTLLVSTTGSISSDFVDMARPYLEPAIKLFQNFPYLSFIFEIVDPADPHIIVEDIGAYLLATRRKAWTVFQHYHTEFELDKLAQRYNFKRPIWGKERYGEVAREMQVSKREGVVVYTEDQQKELKIKTKHYLVTKFLGRANVDKMAKFLDDPDRLKRELDEEYYPVVEYLFENKDAFLAMGKPERITMVREFLERI